MPMSHKMLSFVEDFRPRDMTAPPSGHGDVTTSSPSTTSYEMKTSDDPEKATAEVSEMTREDFTGVGPHGSPAQHGVVTDAQGRRYATADTGLKRNLSSRHMQMIAFGGAIGTGLFVGSGGALAKGGPASLLMDFIIMGVLLASTILALGELATVLPVSGSFAAYSTRFIDPAWGFAIGWNYWMQWFVILPLELVAASIVIGYWDPNENITPGVWITLFIILVFFINCFGVRGYGEWEFASSGIKILAVLGFIIVGIVIQTGGSPSGEYLGARTWQNGEAFKNGFKGWCSVFVTASFAFGGTELVGLAAAESANPRKEVPKASKQVFYRVFFFYIITLFLITLIVPSDTPALLGGSSSYDARASPFVIAMEIGKIKVLPDIFNAVILVSVLSVGNSSVYGSSRTLCAMAQVGLAPKIFGYVDRKGRPTYAVLLSLAFGFLAFLVYSASKNDVFDWLLGLSGLSSIFTWGSLNWCHIRFRQAWKLQGKTLEELPWKSPLGTWFSWVGLFLNFIVLLATFYKAGWP
ncbi:general amino-acid permease GAP1, partial [Jaminaea rosea]